MTLSASVSSQTIGKRLESGSRSLVPFIAFAYVAGFMLGTLIHNLNRSLSSLVSPAPLHSLSPSPAPLAALPPSPAPLAALPPVSASILTIDSLNSLTVKQLRIIARQAGYRSLARNGRRADLLAVLS